MSRRSRVGRQDVPTLHLWPWFMAVTEQTERPKLCSERRETNALNARRPQARSSHAGACQERAPCEPARGPGHCANTSSPVGAVRRLASYREGFGNCAGLSFGNVFVKLFLSSLSKRGSTLLSPPTADSGPRLRHRDPRSEHARSRRALAWAAPSPSEAVHLFEAPHSNESAPQTAEPDGATADSCPATQRPPLRARALKARVGVGFPFPLRDRTCI